MSTTYNSNVMAEFRDHVVISSWTGSVTPAMQDMLRLTTNGTDYMQQFLSTENQYRTALSVLSSARKKIDVKFVFRIDATWRPPGWCVLFINHEAVFAQR
eukprot:COSAG03_NODE_22_length_20538_cov_27.667286_1_plen_100_part_00